jgi:hypothetical protein
VSISADLIADLMRMFMLIGQKVKEHYAPSIAMILPIYLPITQVRGVDQVGYVHIRPKTLHAVAERSDSIGKFGRHLRTETETGQVLSL